MKIKALKPNDIRCTLLCAEGMDIANGGKDRLFPLGWKPSVNQCTLCRYSRLQTFDQIKIHWLKVSKQMIRKFEVIYKSMFNLKQVGETNGMFAEDI